MTLSPITAVFLDVKAREDSVTPFPVKIEVDAERDGQLLSVNVLKDSWVMTAVFELRTSRVSEETDFSLYLLLWHLSSLIGSSNSHSKHSKTMPFWLL